MDYEAGQVARLESGSHALVWLPLLLQITSGANTDPCSGRSLLFHSLTRELEKKFSDRHVVFVGQRRILGKPSRKNRNQQPRPHSRTLTAVHESILEDLVYPSEITGKRTRVATDGSRLVKCFLDSKDATSLEYKLDSFSSIYKKLTGRDVSFQFSSDN
jgi:small subunit ribosomal protein S7e